MDSGKRLLLDLYRRMLLIRRFEEQVRKMARRKVLAGFPHTYVGEEAVAAGVCAHLKETDAVFSTHRGHGHALAMGCDPQRLMAELLGRATGYCGGRGGSMHVTAVDKGLIGCSGIVAASMPLATGAGLRARLKRDGTVAVAFFGDGASNHGAFHESLNLAGNLALPVLFVCENNQFATHTSFASVTANPDVASRAASYSMPGVALDGNDVWAVHQAAEEAVSRARAGGGPTLLECHTYRTVGHQEHGPVYGEYRTKEEVEAWKKRCPIRRLRERLLAEEPALAELLERVEHQVAQAVAEAAELAERSPYPEPMVSEEQAYAG